MSEVIEQAVSALSEKMDGADFDGSIKFVIADEGSIMVDSDGVRAGDDEADCTMTADADTFQSILGGDLNPTAAFMSGKLTVDGDMSAALKLGTVLS